MAARKPAFDAEPARQRHNDALCKEFAALADPFSKWIHEQKENITESRAELEAQLAAVVERIESADADGAKLAPIRAKQAEMDEAGIANNRHTTLTLKDLEVQFDLFRSFLAEKRKMLETEIENARLKGLTEQDLNEIRDNFQSFDSNKDDKIDKKELRSALYSLGEEKTRAEIDALFAQLAVDNLIPFEKFREFMIELLGVSDSKEEIISGFSLINKFDPKVADVARMAMVLNEHDVNYLKETAPKVDGGVDYVAWTEDVYSR